jgi:hypothetical protein
MMANVEIPQRCFCGCGEQRGKTDSANLEGFAVSFALVYWLQQMTLHQMGRGYGHSLSEFVSAGRDGYRALFDQVHEGHEPTRRERRDIRRWLQSSEEAREKIDENDPVMEAIDFPQVGPADVRDWVLTGNLPQPYQEMVDSVEQLRQSPG